MKLKYGILDDESSDDEDQPTNKKVTTKQKKHFHFFQFLYSTGIFFQSSEHPNSDEEKHDIQELLRIQEQGCPVWSREG